MKRVSRTIVLISMSTSLLLTACTSTKNTNSTAPTVQRVPAKFDFSPPSRAKSGAANISIVIVKPTYVGKNPEYFVPPFNEMATRMGDDFEELLIAKGFTIRAKYGSRDEMIYTDKVNSSFALEIGIDINPQYNRKYLTSTKTNWGALLDKNAPSSISTQRMSGEVTFAGSLVINARSSQFGELIWKKSIALEPASFTYTGSLAWTGIPTMAEELNKDNLVYNTLSTELEKFYLKALNLAWQQLDPEEMKGVALEAKKADKKGN